MELRHSWDDMRTRTAWVFFLTAVVLGGLLTFVMGAAAETKVISGASAASAPGAVTKPALTWREFGAGLEEAKSSKRPMVVSVYTDWCGWCKRMDRDTYTNADVQQYLDASFVPVKMNAESSGRATYKGDEYSHRQLASGFRVSGYPTTLFFDADGAHILSAPGYMNARDYLVVLRYVAEGAYKTVAFDEFRQAAAAAAPAAPTP